MEREGRVGVDQEVRAGASRFDLESEAERREDGFQVSNLGS